MKSSVLKCVSDFKTAGSVSASSGILSVVSRSTWMVVLAFKADPLARLRLCSFSQFSEKVRLKKPKCKASVSLVSVQAP